MNLDIGSDTHGSIGGVMVNPCRRGWDFMPGKRTSWPNEPFRKTVSGYSGGV